MLFIISLNFIYTQNGILYNSEIAQEGYVLCTHDFNTYLIDQCGQKVNSWSAWNMDFHAKLTDEGSIYYIKDGKIIERDWEDNIIAEIEHNVPELKLVYDIIKMSNGNYLVNCRWAINQDELLSLGWDINLGSSNLIDGIVEINPDGEVLWAWNIKEHTIQDQVTNATNHGSVDDNPQLMDIRAISNYDWKFGEAFMFNGFDYNEELDLILISVRKMSELIIIDHSTTTKEASGNLGGTYGKGGDILYRWGNPKNYNPNTIAERFLYYQHNPNWIEYGEHKGGIIVFNNGLSTNTGSSVIIIKPEVDENGQFLMADSIFVPSMPARKIGYEIFDFRFSDYTSGAKVMENGNIYITSGEWDQFIEVTPNDEIAWNYKLEGFHYTFRTEKYAKTHTGLADKDLTPEGTIESPSSVYECVDFSVSTNDINKNDISIYHDPAMQTLSIETKDKDQFSIYGYDLMGRIVLSNVKVRSGDTLDVSNIENQIIVLYINYGTNRSVTKKIYIP
jgi:hypothetical protein